MEILIDLQYLPNTLYFSLLAKADKVILEKHENFVKQTYRNRSHILTSQGIDVLSIPLLGSQKKVPVSEIKIDYKQKWVNRHWKAIQSAYGKAPFFIHYADMFEQELYSNYSTLFELNQKLLTLCLKLLQIEISVEFSEAFEKKPSQPIIDLRSAVHPKKPFTNIPQIVFTPYNQIFGKRFVEGLSVLDLLFSEGPNSEAIIKGQIIR
ncbi:MAG: WbqC family protein [Cyclobacteriaceae bacterium]|nr:WbqC family protein [Cyclobacteriaceae bacterium]